MVDLLGQGGRLMVSARDAAAFKLLYDTRAARLTRATVRAEKWIAGLTALVTVLTTALVVKGPDNFAEADGAVRWFVLVLVLAGVFGIGAGLVFAYSAAFGGLFTRGALDTLIESPPTVATGAANTLESAASQDAATSRRGMRWAVGATVTAMVCLLAAVSVSWFASPDSAEPSSICLQTGDGVLELSEEPAIVSGTATFVDCP